MWGPDKIGCLHMINVSLHSTSERLIPRWFVGTSKGGTAGLGDLMLLHTQRQGSNPRQLVKGEWVLTTQPHTPGLNIIDFYTAFLINKLKARPFIIIYIYWSDLDAQTHIYVYYCNRLIAPKKQMGHILIKGKCYDWRALNLLQKRNDYM